MILTSLVTISFQVPGYVFLLLKSITNLLAWRKHYVAVGKVFDDWGSSPHTECDLMKTAKTNNRQYFFLAIFFCSQSGNHPSEEIAKSSYKSEIKYKSLISLLYFWLHDENQ